MADVEKINGYDIKDASAVHSVTVTQNLTSGTKVGSVSVDGSSTDLYAPTTTAATAAPGKVASSSAQGSSTNYARQDHTHGIDLATGDSNGQVKIAGTNVPVKGLAALAYKASLSKSDVGLGNVDNTSDANKPVSTATQMALDEKAKKTQGIYFVKGTQTTTTPAWTGVIDLDALYDGLTIAYYLPTTSASGVTLNLTLSGGGTTGEVKVYFTGVNPMAGHYAAGSTIILTYWSAGSISVNGTPTTENRWTHADYANSNTYDRTYINTSIKAATATTAKFLLCGTDAGYKNVAKGIAFDISYPLLYCASAIAASGTRTDGYIQTPVDCTTTNGGTGPGFTAYKMVFLKGKLTAGKTFTIDSSTLFTQTVPSSEDTYQYYSVGIAGSATNIFLTPHHDVYEYTDGSFHKVAVHQTIKMDGVTGATVNRFGTCSTAAATAAKTVSITTGTFSLEAGAQVTVKFSNANTANSPTLNVNSKGAKNIFVNGAQITSGGNKALLAGTVIFIYDGTQFHLIGNYYDTNTQTVTGVKGDSESSYRTGNVNLTAANIGAAASSHNHAASNITSGTLGVARGGTGNATGRAASVTYVTTAPTANNTDGVKIAVLSSEPSTKYTGWLYIITG